MSPRNKDLQVKYKFPKGCFQPIMYCNHNYLLGKSSGEPTQSKGGIKEGKKAKQRTVYNT